MYPIVTEFYTKTWVRLLPSQRNLDMQTAGYYGYVPHKIPSQLVKSPKHLCNVFIPNQNDFVAHCILEYPDDFMICETV